MKVTWTNYSTGGGRVEDGRKTGDRRRAGGRVVSGSEERYFAQPPEDGAQPAEDVVSTSGQGVEGWIWCNLRAFFAYTI
jgi:hypothetical protein